MNDLNPPHSGSQHRYRKPIFKVNCVLCCCRHIYRMNLGNTKPSATLKVKPMCSSAAAYAEHDLSAPPCKYCKAVLCECPPCRHHDICVGFTDGYQPYCEDCNYHVVSEFKKAFPSAYFQWVTADGEVFAVFRFPTAMDAIEFTGRFSVQPIFDGADVVGWSFSAEE